jgi:hypothetical protein
VGWACIEFSKPARRRDKDGNLLTATTRQQHPNLPMVHGLPGADDIA